MKQDQIGFEVLGEIRCAFCTSKEVDLYRGVDQDHCAPSRIGSRRREATSTSGTFPRSAANRRRAASSTSAFRPSRTATDLVGAPVTRTASSRRSRSISIVVLMHRASHELLGRVNDAAPPALLSGSCCGRWTACSPRSAEEAFQRGGRCRQNRVPEFLGAGPARRLTRPIRRLPVRGQSLLGRAQRLPRWNLQRPGSAPRFIVSAQGLNE